MLGTGHLANNGAGLHVHQSYGFGDSNAAVALARTITPVGPERGSPCRVDALGYLLDH